MRLVLVGPTHPYKGGIAQHTTELAHRLTGAGHDVRLWSWSKQYPARLYPGQQTIETPELPIHPGTSYPLAWNRPDGWWAAGRRIRRSGADGLVIVWVTPVQAPAYATLLRAAGRGLASAAICHNVLPHERRRFDEPLARSVLGRVSGLVVHSDAERSRAAELVATPAHVVPLPPLALTVRQGAAAGTAARRHLLFFGMVRHYKGLDVLLRALAQVPDVRLTVAGEFWEDADLTRRLIDELDLAGRVELREGYVDAADVPSLFASADALMLPYRASTASAHAYIAFSHGIPVVGTTAGSIPQQVRDGVDGLLVPPDDAAALAGAIQRLYGRGVLTKLCKNIPPVDVDTPWQQYVDILLAAVHPS